MVIYNLFFLPVLSIFSGLIFSGYNPKYYDTHFKYISQNGMNLTFLKFTDAQWKYFLNKLSKKYFTIFAFISLLFNIVVDFIVYSDSDVDTMWYKFIFWIIGELLTFTLMIYKTKKIK